MAAIQVCMLQIFDFVELWRYKFWKWSSYVSARNIVGLFARTFQFHEYLLSAHSFFFRLYEKPYFKNWISEIHEFIVSNVRSLNLRLTVCNL